MLHELNRDCWAADSSLWCLCVERSAILTILCVDGGVCFRVQLLRHVDEKGKGSVGFSQAKLSTGEAMVEFSSKRKGELIGEGELCWSTCVNIAGKEDEVQCQAPAVESPTTAEKFSGAGSTLLSEDLLDMTLNHFDLSLAMKHSTLYRHA